jgi:hypothetical protein
MLGFLNWVVSINTSCTVLQLRNARFFQIKLKDNFAVLPDILCLVAFEAIRRSWMTIVRAAAEKGGDDRVDAPQPVSISIPIAIPTLF